MQTINQPAEVRPDFGAMNRELLAERLYAAYHGIPYDPSRSPFFSEESRASWLRAADAAVDEVLGE